MLPERITKKRREQRIRCPGHLKWVRGFKCCVPGCDRRPIEAAHVRLGTNGGMGMKPDDTWVVSLCRDHHRRQHEMGERGFEIFHNVDLKAIAQEFAAKSPHRKKWERAA
jgi:hypothetical protein